MAIIGKIQSDGTMKHLWRQNQDGSWYNFETGKTTKESPYEINSKKRKQAKSCQEHNKEKGSSTKGNS